MDTDVEKLYGVVNEIGLERDEEQFSNFNLKVGIVMKTKKKLTYNEGERIIKQLRKNLLGKNIELETISIPCPVCQKNFNTAVGLKHHIRRMHANNVKKKKRKKKTKSSKKPKKSTKTKLKTSK